MYNGFIDPPSPFAPLDEWRKFLREMETEPHPRAVEIERAIDNAKREIARRE